MLQLIDISLKRGSNQLFEHLTCTIHPGHKVGMVGRNGAGKSTLFDMILGRLQPDEGEVSRPSGWVASHMAQEVNVTDRPAIEHVIDGHRELRAVERRIAQAESRRDDLTRAELHTRFGDVGGHQARARAGTILHGLGFAADEIEQPFRAFSGGMRIRLNLAQALMAPADLLLLDEPTNHLDLETTVWLESWLQRFAGTLLVIAHDRAFLDGVCDHIVHIEHGRANSYRGNYSSFERQRAEALAQQQAAHARQQAEIKHMQHFIDRFRAKASKAKQAQSRMRALERMQAVAPVHADSPYRFSFANPEQMSHPLLSLEDVSVGYEGRAVIEHVRQTLLPGARIGILGANGAGKSTLLKCLVGELEPLAGTLVRGRHSAVGYFAQHQLERLDGQTSALATLTNERPQAREQWCRDYLGRWGFPADMVERPIVTLSGGEKARLVLALIALAQPAILVLDEPTNHLDLEMREALALALQDYAGALLLVSHDRSLLRRAVDEFWLVEGGRLASFAGDIDAYAESRLRRSEPPSSERAPETNRKALRQAAAAQREAAKPLRAKLRHLEKEMDQIGVELREVESRLADGDVYRSLPPEELDDLLSAAGRLRKRLDATEQAWLSATEALEALEQS